MSLHKEIELTRGLVTIVDAETYEELSSWKWLADPGHAGQFYACRHATRLGDGVPRPRFYMHREVLRLAGVAAPHVVDHINGCTLDNRLKNLRPATVAENSRNRRLNCNNTSGFKGVWYHKPTGKWISAIRLNRGRIHLGRFLTPEAAASAYAEAAKEFFGAFVRATPPAAKELIKRVDAAEATHES